jgi:hypothetical protein
MADDDALKTQQVDTLLYTAIFELLTEDYASAKRSFKEFTKRLEAGEHPDVTDIVSIVANLMDDVTELELFEPLIEEEDYDEETEVRSGEKVIQFEITTLMDEDPKKRLN